VTLLRKLSMLAAAVSAAMIIVLTVTPLALEDDGCALRLPCGVGHALAFGVLGVALAGAFVSSSFARGSPRRALAMLLLCLWIFAALTELAQAEVGRDPSLADWAADMAGAIAGLIVGGFVLRVLLAGRLPASVPAPPSATRSRGRRGAKAAKPRSLPERPR
jgi:hypothetical protein